ncbi:MAG: methyltransferase [Chitinophagaceae bacterium]|nr:methyltransferase [Chitinophagaceae bacterium]
MSNSYFKFKQFTIEQDACAMKVCTDACLFGAWVAQEIIKLKVEKILDIGTGTGLLSLMLAQQNNLTIDAVEIDDATAKQANENVITSPWANKIKVIKADIRKLEKEEKYDFIISNTPFFDNDLKSENEQRNRALHSSDLSANELILSIKRLLKTDGYFALLLPPHRANQQEQIANDAGFFISQQVTVRQTEQHGAFRVMLLFSNNKTEPEFSEMVIKKQGQYSKEFTALLKDYYLYL